MPPGSAIWDSCMRAARAWSRAGRRRCGGTALLRSRGCPVPSATWPGAMSTARAWSRTGSGLSTGTDRRRTRRTPGGCSAWASAANTAAAWRQNWEEAVHWYRRAVDAGSAAAMCNLGVCYERGEGVERDARGGSPSCTDRRRSGRTRPPSATWAICMRPDEGVEQNWQEAVRWYQAAAEQGYPRAQCNLGVCWEFGQRRGEGPGQGSRFVPAGCGAAATGWPPATWDICTRPVSAWPRAGQRR